MTDATPTSRAEAWLARGKHFSWSPAGESAAPVNVFHVELGDADAPVLALVHGFPTCSIDWFEVAERLSSRYRVCMLDFPGFGFSEKPRGWGYSLRRDAELLDHYLTQIVGAQSVVMVAHDRGDSVSLIHTTNEAAGRRRPRSSTWSSPTPTSSCRCRTSPTHNGSCSTTRSCSTNLPPSSWRRAWAP